ncbi:MAG TPA: response regulator [Gemmatimonadaceae bacterium]|nr:response regulator [Gemmatimonadaceae bacterium]
MIEDETKIRAVVRDALAGDVDHLTEAASGQAGVALAEAEHPDLVVLDLGLPDMEGVDVCRRVRQWSSAPIIVLSARHSEEEKVRLLDAGADDYVTKPFSVFEFRARVRAQLRRARMAPVPGGDHPLVLGDLTIDVARRTVLRDGEAMHLSPTEWALLQALVTNAGRTMTHQQLFRAVWGPSSGDPQSYLRVYVAHLRRKIERDSYAPRYLLTEPGVGYRFEAEPPDGT